MNWKATIKARKPIPPSDMVVRGDLTAGSVETNAGMKKKLHDSRRAAMHVG
jgi:hypothetical protein